jgi:hypothetical protein
MNSDQMKILDLSAASVSALQSNVEGFRIFGEYQVQCHDKAGNLLWEDVAPNLVTDVGAKLLLDTILAGSAFTATTYMGLKGTGAAAVGDTQASHAGWLEVGAANAPTYTSPRKTISWSSASGTGAGSRTKPSTGTYTFAITSGSGVTVDGCFININGTSAIDNTTGTLFSAGTFSGGAKTVSNGDSLTVTYALNC